MKRAAGGSLKNTGRKKLPKIRHLGTITQLCLTTLGQGYSCRSLIFEFPSKKAIT